MRAVFAVLAMALMATLGWQWYDWPPAAPEPGTNSSRAVANQEPSQPQTNPLDLLTPLREKEEYLVVAERPLFVSGRRPPSLDPEEEPEPETEETTDLDRMDLNAVLITPSQSLAWVRDPSTKELLKLRPGDRLAEWFVEEVLPDRVVLKRQGETGTLVLRDYKNMPPPVAQRRPRQVKARPPVRRTNRPQPNANQPAGRSGDAPRRPNIAPQPRAQNPSGQ